MESLDWLWGMCAANTASATQPITSGRASTRGSQPISSNGLRILMPRTASSSAFITSLLWRIRLLRMFYPESCSAGSKESGGHGDGSGPSNLQGQSLQNRGFLAVGVLQIHSGLGRPRTRQWLTRSMRLLPSGTGRAFGSAIKGFSVTATYGTTNECKGCIAR